MGRYARENAIPRLTPGACMETSIQALSASDGILGSRRENTYLAGCNSARFMPSRLSFL
jgi:hypothetical protein